MSGTKGLFFETSALIRNVVAGPEVKAGILHAARSFSILGSSCFVHDECVVVLRGAYNTVIDAVRRVLNPDRPRRFSDIWQDAVDIVGTPNLPGGNKMCVYLEAALRRKLKSELVTPREIVSLLEGQRENALESIFFIGDRDILRESRLIDQSSCCGWRETMRSEERR